MQKELIMSRARDLAGIFNLNPLSGTTAQRPATAEVGEIYYNGTTGKTQIYTTTGWQDMASGIPYGNTAGRPSGVTGQPYFNGDIGRLELYTATTGWQNIVQETPGVSSVTGTYLESSGSGTITISGTNFVSGCYATAIGTNGVQTDATTTVFNSIVQVSATFTGLSAEFEPYDIKVTNPSNLFGMIPDALYVNQTPLWTTPAGSIGTVLERGLVAFQFTASDPENTTLAYASSNIPSWLTLTSSGVLSGVAPSIDDNTTYNFNVTISDAANTAVSRAFSLTVNALSAVELLLVGGGGGGGSTISGHHEGAGGGGAGGLYYNATMPITGSHLITVGAGGAGGVGSAGENGYTGQNSVFGNKIGLGGGGGGGQYANGQNTGINGGSGGGWCGHAGFGRSTNTGLQSSSETGGLGNAGGQASSGGPYGGGGGGGAGSGGHNGSTSSGSSSGGGVGGAGVQYSITGTSQWYAAGGGGAAQSNGSGGAGGSGIGGNGSSSGGSAGAANTGSGGGASGASGQSTGGSGGSGVVIFAVPGNHTAQNIPGTLTYTRDTTSRSGHTVYRFTAGTGTISL